MCRRTRPYDALADITDGRLSRRDILEDHRVDG